MDIPIWSQILTQHADGWLDISIHIFHIYMVQNTCNNMKAEMMLEYLQDVNSLGWKGSPSVLRIRVKITSNGFIFLQKWIVLIYEIYIMYILYIYYFTYKMSCRKSTHLKGGNESKFVVLFAVFTWKSHQLTKLCLMFLSISQLTSRVFLLNLL